MEFKSLRRYYNLCNPNEPLAPDDVRNVDLDSRGEPGKLVRGVNWVNKLARRVELSDEPICELFTGLRGSGKSTELMRLAARLKREDGARLLPVIVNAEDVLDLTNPIDVPDIIAAIVHQTERAVLIEEGQSPELALKDGYLTRLWNWLSRTDVSLKELSVDPTGGAGASNLVFEMKTRPTLREKVRLTVSAHLTTFLRDAGAELKGLLLRANAKGFTGVIVVLDSLEKLRGTSSNWHQVLESAERVFAGGAPYLKLPVHVLYTVPPAVLSRRVNNIYFMPMIKLTDREGSAFKPGLDAAREIIDKRVDRAVLSEILGPTAYEDRVRRMIAWSGGYPREIVRLLQSVIASWDGSLSESAFNRVFNEVADEYRKIVPSTAFPWLARVAVDRYMTLESEEQQQSADLMLSNNVVLRYLNDRDWFELHPAAREIPGVRDAITRLKSA